MPITESLPIALFLMFFVFLVLMILCIFIKVFSKILGSISKSVESKADVVEEKQLATVTPIPQDAAYGGTLVLDGIDEPTAAMVMAIVSDESGIPVSELVFKSIRKLPKDSQKAPDLWKEESA